MIKFITVQTDSHERRRVSLSLSDKTPETAFLLGNLVHNTQFLRKDLVELAHDILYHLDPKHRAMLEEAEKFIDYVWDYDQEADPYATEVEESRIDILLKLRNHLHRRPSE